jgi:predicted RND superfamily exporter protein
VTGAKLVAMLEEGEGLVGMLVVEAVEKTGEALVISGRSSVVGIAVLVTTG